MSNRVHAAGHQFSMPGRGRFSNTECWGSLLSPTARCPQFNICANSSLHDYAKIFPRNNLTVAVDFYQGVSAGQGWAWPVPAAASGAEPAREGACLRL